MTKSLDYIVLGMDKELTAQGANVDGQFVVNLIVQDIDFGAYLEADDIDALIEWLVKARDWVS
jgi:hypothetical protein